jgi:hypothetical protein
MQKPDRADNFEKNYSKKITAKPSMTAKKIFLWASCLSFTPDHAMDPIDSFAFDEYAHYLMARQLNVPIFFFAVFAVLAVQNIKSQSKPFINIF